MRQINPVKCRVKKNTTTIVLTSVNAFGAVFYGHFFRAKASSLDKHTYCNLIHERKKRTIRKNTLARNRKWPKHYFVAITIRNDSR